MKLPSGLVKCLERQGVEEKGIIFAAMGDLDEEFRFADTVVALTNKKLIIAKYPYREKKEIHLGGYNSWSLEEKETGEPAVLLYDLERVEQLEVLRQVSTGVLMGKIDGTERYLCQFSNTKMESDSSQA